jgi:thiol-disulfide isomerase/thioredoxin
MKPSVVILLTLTVLVLVLVSLAAVGMTEGFADAKGYGETNQRGTFVMYYADWCPHCQNVKPLFKDFMGTGVVQVNGLPVKVKMVEEKQIQKGVDPEIKGYPSFLYSDAAGRVVEFDGPRTADGFMEFLKEKVLS